MVFLMTLSSWQGLTGLPLKTIAADPACAQQTGDAIRSPLEIFLPAGSRPGEKMTGERILTRIKADCPRGGMVMTNTSIAGAPP
ncbi:hypothetical protein [Rhizobium sp. CSW-27]|uniref:hypothetical protein n=1 Tax=Rhizobium sp. CSW-27 TaxID=2839985 RepID=UPI001C02F440|nr:hypothetical protein [Rhizobium sp. CSW-27]MBT9368340.1 hypothetical protein [Rhizobium sp. CSW-27]